MSTPHPVPIIAQVLTDLAKRFEDRAEYYHLTEQDAQSGLCADIARQIQDVVKELK